MARVNCIGAVVADALSGPLVRYPEPRVLPAVVTGSIQLAAGGGASNTGGAMAKMGLNVGVFSKVGDDPNGAFLLRELAQTGVDTRAIRVAAGETTPFTFVGIHPNGDRTFIHTPGTNLSFNAADVDPEFLFAADYLLYQDCWGLPRLDGQAGAGLLAEAQRRGIVTLLDECWGLGPNRDVFEIMLPHTDYVLPSCDDMRAIYPDFTIEAIADHLLSQGAKTVALKMGAEGCLVAHNGAKTRVPAVQARVVDTTGAGDCWNAGFIAGLAHGADVLAAARLGNACAAFCIEETGGCTGIPEYAAVVQRSDRS